jgi:spore coat polysaccharide biosynthesis protein SpsF (cytidylyltransferase family)
MDEFEVARLEARGKLNRPDIRLDVDYAEDAGFIRELTDRLNPSSAPFWTTAEIIDALDANPGLSSLRNERGQIPALAND